MDKELIQRSEELAENMTEAGILPGHEHEHPCYTATIKEHH